jgi:hypothetical protein
MQIPIGVQISNGYTSGGLQTTDTSQMVWYQLSDHNRQPISVQYDLIEQVQRMGNGILRKYIVARKFKITTDWRDFPTLDANLVDYDAGAHGGAWIKAFYEAYSFQPIYVKLMYALDDTPSSPSMPNATTYKDSKSTTGQIFNAFMTTFKYDILKRRVGSTSSITGYDYVNLSIEFTEI